MDVTRASFVAVAVSKMPFVATPAVKTVVSLVAARVSTVGPATADPDPDP